MEWWNNLPKILEELTAGRHLHSFPIAAVTNDQKFDG